MENTQFPFEGQLYPAVKRKFSPLIFFVHFYQGDKRRLLRHIRLVNSLGFDAFAFNLKENPKHIWNYTFNSQMKFGLKHMYAEQITELLNLLPGKKIIFSFSNPSASAIEAIAFRNHFDILGLICDSGPSAKFKNSSWNLFRHEKHYHFAKTLVASQILSYLWSPLLHNDIHQDLLKFPADFPILSLQGEKDLLIPPDHIEAAFTPHKQLDYKKFVIKNCGHLLGLRDFPDVYKPVVKDFLFKISEKFII